MKQLLFVRTASRIATLVKNGTFLPGDKLPSLRKLAQEWGISVGTILQAYMLLEDQGIVSSKEKSGFFVLSSAQTGVQAPASFKGPIVARNVFIQAILTKVTREHFGKQLISFFDAVPMLHSLPFGAIRRSVQTVSRDLKGKYISYETTQGNLALRQLIARRSYHWNGALNANDVVITNGALEGIHLSLRATTSPGDTVLVQTPCYYGILQCIENLQLKVIELPSQADQEIDFQELKKICRKFSVAACVLVPTFNNPNGVTLTDTDKQRLARFAHETKTPVIEDDIYGDLYVGAHRPRTIKTFDEHGWVVLCSSFSKTIAPGFRIGWCAGGRFNERIIQLKAVTNVATTSLIQHTMIELLRSGAYDRHLRKLRVSLGRQVSRTAHAIEKYFPSGTRISKPEGGYVLWLELPGKIHSGKLQQLALENTIDIAPGFLFSNSGGFKNYIRISCCNPWSDRVDKAIRKVGALCHELME